MEGRFEKRLDKLHEVFIELKKSQIESLKHIDQDFHVQDKRRERIEAYVDVFYEWEELCNDVYLKMLDTNAENYEWIKKANALIDTKLQPNKNDLDKLRNLVNNIN